MGNILRLQNGKTWGVWVELQEQMLWIELLCALSNTTARNVTFELRPDLSTAPGPDDLASMFDGRQPGAFGR